MSTGAIAGGLVAAVVVTLLCIGGAVFAIVYIQRRKKRAKKCSGKVEITRYASCEMINAKTCTIPKEFKQTSVLSMYRENTG